MGPLAGLKVVEVSVAMAGPFCGMTLADYGAEVVKIERVGAGDESRNWPPHFNGKLGHYFAAANRNKQSLALDLKSAEGIQIARRLIGEADVLIDNYRVGALDRAGLGYEPMAALNPRLIYCSISGFGRGGPRREERANDLFMQAYSGGMSITGEPDGAPAKMGISIADIGAGQFATIGILMALNARHHSGHGQYVNTSLLQGQLAMLSYHLTAYFASGRVPGRQGSGGQVGVPYQAFAASDDWVVVAAFNEQMWRGVCAVVGKPQWCDDPRFCTVQQRVDNRELLTGLLSELFAAQPAKHWQEQLLAQGVPCTPVHRIDQIVVDPQVQALGMIAEIEAPSVGTIRMAGLPIQFTQTPGSIDSAPPQLGEHSEAILQRLGYGASDIERLAASGTIGVHCATSR
jgi:crotonobetainyl-CoA:carnitine CoA-transferase CaiB-like acyl-CoA transferase